MQHQRNGNGSGVAIESPRAETGVQKMASLALNMSARRTDFQSVPASTVCPGRFENLSYSVPNHLTAAVGTTTAVEEVPNGIAGALLIVAEPTPSAPLNSLKTPLMKKF